VLQDAVPEGRPGALARRAEPGLTASVIAAAARAFGACDEEAALHREVVAALAPSVADAAALDLPDEDGGVHRVASIAAAGGGVAPPRAGGLVAEVLRTGRSRLLPRLVPAPGDAGPGGELAVMAASHVASALAVAVPGRGGVLGVMTLVRGADGPPFGEDDAGAAQAIAAAGGLALEALRLREREAEARRGAEVAAQEAARLQVAASTFAGALSPRQVADVAHASARTLLGADGAALYEASGGRLVLVRAGGSLADADPAVPLDEASPLADAARCGRPRLRGAFAALPLHARRRILGVLQLAFPPHGGIRPNDLGVALALSSGAAQAFERASLFRAGRRARSDARRAVRARDEFLSIAAHELRSPVAALQLRLGALRRSAGASAAALDPVARQGDRLAALVERLLDVSRIAAGQLDLHPADVDLAALVRDAAARARDELQHAGCALSVEAPPALPAAVDPLRMDEVIGNLLSNAARHAAGAPVALVLAREGVLARLEVRDRGPGVPPAERGRLFDRFERGAASRAGLGLGLWIVRRIVAAHGGVVRVEDAPGGGAAFVVELPLSG
jgi:signal transduction histidine kinase